MKKIIIILIMAMVLMTSCSVSPPSNGEAGDADKKAVTDSDKASVEIGLTQGRMAPDFTLKDIDGNEVSLSDYRGKIVVLNFFGVWCGWCIKEMPGFMKVYNDYKDKGVELLVVDVGDTEQTVRDYLDENGFDIKPVMDYENRTASIYRVNGFPTSFIIDRDGIIARDHRGYMDEALLRNMLELMVR